MERFSALLAICAENSPVPGEFAAQRPVTRTFDLCLNKRLSKQLWGWWFETLSSPLWRHSNVDSGEVKMDLMLVTSQWRHNEHDGGVPNHHLHHCLLNILFRRRSKKTSNLRVIGLCMKNSPVTGEFPAQGASNAESVSIWWRQFEEWDISSVFYHHSSESINHLIPGIYTLKLCVWLTEIHMWHWNVIKKIPVTYRSSTQNHGCNVGQQTCKTFIVKVCKLTIWWLL